MKGSESTSERQQASWITLPGKVQRPALTSTFGRKYLVRGGGGSHSSRKPSPCLRAPVVPPALALLLAALPALAPVLMAVPLQGCGMAGDAGSWDAYEDTIADQTTDGSPDSVPGDAYDGEYVPQDWELACQSCSSTEACDDGLTCTGQEQCMFSQWAGQSCCHAEPIECPTGDPCMLGACSEETGACEYDPLDSDGDGHPPLGCGYDDCDDSLYAVHPGARELCDGLDNDCDGAVDEDAWTPTGAVIELSAPGQAPSSPALEPGADSWAVAWVAAASGTDAVLQAGVISPGTPGVSDPVATVGEVALAAGEPAGVALVGVPAGAGPLAGDFVVVATVPLTSGSTEVVAVILDGTGATDAVQIDLVTFPASVLDLAAAAIPGSSRAGILFRSDLGGDYEIWFAGLDLSGALPVLDVSPIQLTDSSGFSGKPAMVATSGGFALAWEDGRDGNTEVYFALIDSTAILEGPARRITAAPGDSQDVALASSGEGFGLAWMDSRTGGYELLFTCLDADGARICPEIGLGSAPGTVSPSASWFPALWRDRTPGQLALAYAGEREGEFDMMLTAVPSDGDPAADLVDPGTALGRPSASILGTLLADAAGARAVAWIEHDSSGIGALVLQQLDCVEE